MNGESKAKLCDWCQEYYAIYDLCSGCQLAKEKGYTQHQKKEIRNIFYQMRSEELVNKKMMLDKDVHYLFIDDKDFKKLYSSLNKMAPNLTPRILHNCLIGMMPEKRYFSWQQVKKIFGLLHFLPRKNGDTNKFEYEVVLCQRVADYWNIEHNVMPVGECYFGSRMPTSIGEIVLHKPVVDMLYYGDFDD
jgi:hypothetical protein